MTMATTVVKETAFDAFKDQWDRVVRARLREAEWLTAQRETAWKRFEEHGLPHPRLEAWRKTPIRAITAQAWQMADTMLDVLTKADLAPFQIPGTAAEYVLVDGRYRPDLSTVKGLPQGVRVNGMAAAARDAPDRLARILGTAATFEKPEAAFTALNTAMWNDGIVLEMGKGSRLEAPIHILSLRTASKAPRAAYPRILLNLGEGAEATVVESHGQIGKDGAPTLTVACTETFLGTGARLDHVRIQRERLDASHHATVAARLASNATLRQFSFSEGAALARFDIAAILGVEGVEAHLDGVFLAAGEQLVDHHTFIDHAAPRGTSHEVYKGIVTGKSHGIFYGAVLVRPKAAKTASREENRNLVLSRTAKVDSTPQLEIHNDDVKCGHGSTIGALDPLALHYMRARGIGKDDARRILTQAFAAQALDRVRSEPVRKHLHARFEAWFEAHKTEADR